MNRSHRPTRHLLVYASVGLAAIFFAGCAEVPPPHPLRAQLSAPRPLSAQRLPLDASRVEPMYTELLPIDLPTVARVALAQNADVNLAREEVLRTHGRYQSTVGRAFPVIAPLALFENVDGSVRATEGDIVNVGFNVFQPSIAVQWLLNPGEVAYDIIAAKKRLAAAGHRERAVQLDALRLAALQYHDLILAQARIDAAAQAVTEADELLRINDLAVRAGTGVPADEMRARAQLAERQQDLRLALNAFHRASLALGSTLQLDDPTVTLVPHLDSISTLTLVNDDNSIDDLLTCAVATRPELASLRELLAAAAADRSATWWRGFGPQVGLTYQYGAITGHSNNTDKNDGIPSNLLLNPLSPTGAFSGNPIANGLIREGLLRGSRRLARDHDETFAFSDQQRVAASVGARWSLSSFGDIEAASATQRQQFIEADRALLLVKTEVIDAAQTSRMNRELIDLAQQQVTSAEEALRLVRANVEVGTMTTLDMLQAQQAAAQARLRHAEALVHYNQAQINLLAAIGLLAPDALIS